MATILLVFIYIFYIGLGIPDSLLGSAWPAIYGEFHVPISFICQLYFGDYFRRNCHLQPFQHKSHCKTGDCKGYRYLNHPYGHSVIRLFLFTEFPLALSMRSSPGDRHRLY